jgi:hypothetical protein
MLYDASAANTSVVLISSDNLKPKGRFDDEKTVCRNSQACGEWTVLKRHGAQTGNPQAINSII